MLLVLSCLVFTVVLSIGLLTLIRLKRHRYLSMPMLSSPLDTIFTESLDCVKCKTCKWRLSGLNLVQQAEALLWDGTTHVGPGKQKQPMVTPNQERKVWKRSRRILCYLVAVTLIWVWQHWILAVKVTQTWSLLSFPDLMEVTKCSNNQDYEQVCILKRNLDLFSWYYNKRCYFFEGVSANGLGNISSSSLSSLDSDDLLK